jgi:hypothetical protein
MLAVLNPSLSLDGRIKGKDLALIIVSLRFAKFERRFAQPGSIRSDTARRVGWPGPRRSETSDHA